MSELALEHFVRSALGGLSYPSLLERHALARTASDGRPPGGEGLRRLLVEAIEAARPLATANLQSAPGRQHRQLVLRYLEGRSREEVADELGVSLRQLDRDHQHALETVTAHLWARGVRPPESSQSPRGGDEGSDRGAIARLSDGDAPAAELAGVLVTVLETLRPLADRRSATLDFRVTDTLPPLAIGPTVLRQALLNLLSYLLEVAPGRSILLSAVDTDRGPTLRAALVGLAETGSRGQIDESASELLATARRLLEPHGSILEVPPPDGALLAVVFSPAPRRTLLVVDDNPDLASLFQRYLRGAGWRVIGATTGESAIEIAARLRPELILLDVLLPGQDGWDVLRALRSDDATRDLPVAICSVLPERALAHALGVTDFLAKPVSRDALRELAERHGQPGAA